ncbi:helix-turn-helix domain-containing protein [Kozakia baliensis]|uniref:helix-turn-helix domain-containing protein n=1 Tax=Kozakia baliensis TaxID=153496 RepID=UPI0004956F5B|nr:helix-turn-helix transcriptional regulator [Kozakia baliensis]
MRFAIVLQPGQNWTPSDKAAPHRVVVDIVRGGVLYRLSTDAEDASPHFIAQSGFRRWIREAGAKLAGVAEGFEPKASPSAELGKRIQMLRKAAGMSQQQLAEALSVSRSAVTFWETGREGSANKHFRGLADILGVPMEAFLTGMAEENIQIDLTLDEHDLIQLYRRLTPERKINAQKWIERQTRQRPNEEA